MNNGDVNCHADYVALDAARASSRDRGALLELAFDATKTGFFTWDVAEDRADPDDRFAALFGVVLGGRLDLETALATMIHPVDRERYAEASRGRSILQVKASSMRRSGSRWSAASSGGSRSAGVSSSRARRGGPHA